MRLDFINTRGDILPLVGNSLFAISGITGHTASTVDISSSVTGGVDGDIVNNVQAQPRTITVDLQIRNGVNVEAAKREVLQVLKIKQRGTLEWEQNDREVTISGIVESIEMPRWTSGVTMQFSLHCDQPFWEDAEYIVQEISEAISLHYFTDEANDMLYFPVAGIPFGEYDTTRTKSFYNDGDVPVGMQIEIIALETVTNPIIYDAEGHYFGIGDGTGARQLVMNSRDKLVISTHKGNKTVKLNGVSVFQKVKTGSTWLQMQTGENTFSVNSSDESITNLNLNIVYKRRYV